MIVWTLFLLPFPVLGAISKTHGVAPHLVQKYSPSASGTWDCLDGSKQISWNAVNDDYCDCPDGSDEPGTSACPLGTFYCINEGHIGATLSSVRINDGLCESECCDGSDESPGVCANTCQEVGEAYRKQLEEDHKLRKTGSKIRSSYVAFAQKEKKRLEALVASTSQEVAVREKEVARLKELAEHADSLSAAALELRKQSPLYQSLLSHSAALKSLQDQHKQHVERERQLGDILEALRAGYNPNYQDMAVLEAVRGWEALSGLAVADFSDEELGSDEEVGAEAAQEASQEGKTEEGLGKEVELLLKTDYESLLFEHDRHLAGPTSGSFLFDVKSYLPDTFVPQYEALQETLLSVLQTLGIVQGVIDTSKDTSRARKAYDEATHGLQRTKDEHSGAVRELAELFDARKFGTQGEWKKLENTCLSFNNGEYTYEICLFGEALQKPNKGGAKQSLGHFSSWNPAPDVVPGSPEYYSKQVYKGGSKCWNGPHRSMTLLLACGTENKIFGVSEPEKCEYEARGTSAALCLPPGDAGAGRAGGEL